MTKSDVIDLQYRADIDGLRAVAVVPVVLFHSGLPGITGGFVGVDVFFVISGYLITSIILSQQDAGKLTLQWFYERRIRRIFPALFVVMFACVVLGWLVMTPWEYKSLGGSIIATALFISNVLFWWRSGYFEPITQEQPLLHTWSLAVEEQYYLGFPLLVILLGKLGRPALFRGIAILAFLSFGAGLIAVVYIPISAFYLTPFRAWELFLGSLLAFRRIPFRLNTTYRCIISTFGLGMIFFAVFSYSENTRFPGISAVLPALGAALYLWAGMYSVSGPNRFLGTKPFTFIGKISYSLYLWHFVIFAFGAYLTVGSMTTGRIVILLATSFIVSILSWVAIEQPIRRTTSTLFQGRPLFLVAGFSTVVLAVVGFGIRATDGVRMRASPSQQIIAEIGKGNDIGRTNCVDMNPIRARYLQFCRLGTNDEVTPSFFVWGDSHAMPFETLFSKAADQKKTAGLLASSGGCAPLINLLRKEPTAMDCGSINSHILQFLVDQRSIEVVVLVARWAFYVEGGSYKNQPTNRFNPKHVMLENSTLQESAESDQMVSEALNETVRALMNAGKQVVIIGPIPEAESLVPRSLYLHSLGIGLEHEIAPRREDFERRQARVSFMLKQLSQKHRVRVVWPHEVLCDTKSCAIEERGTPLYVDTNHLSLVGANRLEAIVGGVISD